MSATMILVALSYTIALFSSAGATWYSLGLISADSLRSHLITIALFGIATLQLVYYAVRDQNTHRQQRAQLFVAFARFHDVEPDPRFVADAAFVPYIPFVLFLRCLVAFAVSGLIGIILINLAVALSFREGQLPLLPFEARESMIMGGLQGGMLPGMILALIATLFITQFVARVIDDLAHPPLVMPPSPWHWINWLRRRNRPASQPLPESLQKFLADQPPATASLRFVPLAARVRRNRFGCLAVLLIAIVIAVVITVNTPAEPFVQGEGNILAQIAVNALVAGTIGFFILRFTLLRPSETDRTLAAVENLLRNAQYDQAAALLAPAVRALPGYETLLAVFLFQVQSGSTDDADQTFRDLVFACVHPTNSIAEEAFAIRLLLFQGLFAVNCIALDRRDETRRALALIAEFIRTPYAPANNTRAHLYLLEGDAAAAARELDLAQRAYQTTKIPPDISHHGLVAWRMAMQDEVAGALRLMEQTIQQGAARSVIDHAEAWLFAGRVAQVRGDREGARAAFERVIALDPGANAMVARRELAQM